MTDTLPNTHDGWGTSAPLDPAGVLFLFVERFRDHTITITRQGDVLHLEAEGHPGASITVHGSEPLFGAV